MEIIKNTKDFWLDRPTAVAIGKFDGLHRGHRFLMKEILEQKKNGLAACVFTFDPPLAVFFGVTDGKELGTREEQRLLLEEMGVDILIEFPMSAETAATPPEEFVEEILHKRMKAAFVAAGKDLSFGARGAGDTALLTRMGKELGIRVDSIDKVMYGDRAISSTYIRQLVEAGDLELASELLGGPYRMLGVLHKEGQEMLVQVPSTKLLPPEGIYEATVTVGGRNYRTRLERRQEGRQTEEQTEKRAEKSVSKEKPAKLVLLSDLQTQNEWLTSPEQIAIISLGCNKVVTKL